MKKIKQKDIAEKAKVSISTVSRVLTGQTQAYRINRKTAQKVWQAAKELGYSLDTDQISLDVLGRKTVGLVIPDMSHVFLSILARTIVSTAFQHGYSVVVCDTLEDTNQEKDALHMLLNRFEIDGLLVLPVGKEFEHLEDLYFRNIPLVLVDRVSENLPCALVYVDNYQGAFQAVEHMIERGHTEIACIQRLPHSWINDERIRGYHDALRKYNIPVKESWIIGDQFGQRNGYLETKRLLNSGHCPTAIFALSNIVCLGALRALYEEGLHVPDDISIISFDKIPYLDYFSEKITFIEQPIDEMGLVAFRILKEQIEHQKNTAPVKLKLPVTLQQFDSVRILK